MWENFFPKKCSPKMYRTCSVNFFGQNVRRKLFKNLIRNDLVKIEKLVLSLWSILCMKMVSQCVGWSGIRPIRARLVKISQCQIREKEFSLFKRFQTERHSKNTTRENLKWELFEILPSNDHKRQNLLSNLLVKIVIE